MKKLNTVLSFGVRHHFILKYINKTSVLHEEIFLEFNVMFH